MRTENLLNDVDAGVQQISANKCIDCGQRAEWILVVDSTGLDGTPELFIEQGFTSSCNVSPTKWVIIPNKCEVNSFFPIDDTQIVIEKSDLKGNFFRIRIEPNDNTTGIISATWSYKTFT